MPQFGADTTIGPEVRLIILDCFETLVQLEGREYRARKGVVTFLQHFGLRIGIPLVVHSDGAREEVVRALTQAGILGSFAAYYPCEDAVEILDDGRTRKRLDKPLADYGVRPEDAVFIGDSPMDAQAAQDYGIRFIRVPRSEDGDFCFTRLISGPSNYRSSQFSLDFLKFYRKRPD